MRLSKTLLAIALLATIGCADSPARDGGALDARSDAARSDAGPSGPSIEVGTGPDAFTPFADGDTLDLVAGCQGLQHVWVSLRATGLEPARPTIRMRLIRDRDGVDVSAGFETRVNLRPVTGHGYAEIVGLTLIVPEPDDAVGEALTVEVTVTDVDGVSARASRSITTRIGPPGC